MGTSCRHKENGTPHGYNIKIPYLREILLYASDCVTALEKWLCWLIACFEIKGKYTPYLKWFHRISVIPLVGTVGDMTATCRHERHVSVISVRRANSADNAHQISRESIWCRGLNDICSCSDEPQMTPHLSSRPILDVVTHARNLCSAGWKILKLKLRVKKKMIMTRFSNNCSFVTCKYPICLNRLYIIIGESSPLSNLWY